MPTTKEIINDYIDLQVDLLLTDDNEEQLQEVDYQLITEKDEIKIWDKKYNNIVMEKRVFNIKSRVEEREDGNL